MHNNGDNNGGKIWMENTSKQETWICDAESALLFLYGRILRDLVADRQKANKLPQCIRNRNINFFKKQQHLIRNSDFNFWASLALTAITAKSAIYIAPYMCHVSNIRHKFLAEQCYLHHWWYFVSSCSRVLFQRIFVIFIIVFLYFFLYFCVTLSSYSRVVVQLLEDERRTVAGLCVPGSRTETMTMMMMMRRLIMIMVVMVIEEENSDDDECQKVQYRLKSKLQYWTLFCFSPILSKSSQGGRSCTGARVAPAEKFGLGRKF